jgi:hypothetical protein
MGDTSARSCTRSVSPLLVRLCIISLRAVTHFICLLRRVPAPTPPQVFHFGDWGTAFVNMTSNPPGSVIQQLIADNYTNPPFITAYPTLANVSYRTPIPIWNTHTNNRYCSPATHSFYTWNDGTDIAARLNGPWESVSRNNTELSPAECVMTHKLPASCLWQAPPRSAYSGLGQNSTAVAIILSGATALPAWDAALQTAYAPSAIAFTSLPPTRASVAVPDLLWQFLGLGPASTSGNASFAHSLLTAACSRNFTTLRFAASPFWPSDWQTSYFSNPAAFWDTFSALVDHAKAAGCRLLPSLLWNPWALPDLYGEALGKAADLSTPSPSRDAQLRFVADAVARFAWEPAIVAWEVGDAHNALLDVPLAGSAVGCGPAGTGTPAMRTAADLLTSAAYGDWQRAVVDTIRAADPLRRPVSSGHTLPNKRSRALREAAANSSSAPAAAACAFDPLALPLDSVEDAYASLALQAAATDWLSVQLFAPDVAGRPYVPQLLGGLYNATPIVRVAAEGARRAGKPLIIGAFGDDAGTLQAHRWSLAILAAMQAAGRSAAPWGCLVSWGLPLPAAVRAATSSSVEAAAPCVGGSVAAFAAIASAAVLPRQSASDDAFVAAMQAWNADPAAWVLPSQAPTALPSVAPSVMPSQTVTVSASDVAAASVAASASPAAAPGDAASASPAAVPSGAAASSSAAPSAVAVPSPSSSPRNSTGAAGIDGAGSGTSGGVPGTGSDSAAVAAEAGSGASASEDSTGRIATAIIVPLCVCAALGAAAAIVIQRRRNRRKHPLTRRDTRVAAAKGELSRPASTKMQSNPTMVTVNPLSSAAGPASLGALDANSGSDSRTPNHFAADKLSANASSRGLIPTRAAAPGVKAFDPVGV